MGEAGGFLPPVVEGVTLPIDERGGAPPYRLMVGVLSSLTKHHLVAEPLKPPVDHYWQELPLELAWKEQHPKSWE